MDTTIDTLAIEIESESSNSTKNLDDLINKLTALDEVLSKSTVKMRAFKKALSGLTNAKVKDIKTPKVKMPKTSDTKDKSSDKKKTDTGDTGSGDKKVKDSGDEAETAGKKFAKLQKFVTGVAKAFAKLPVASIKITARSVGTLASGMRKVASVTGKVSTALKNTFSKSLTGSVKKFGLAMIGVRSLFTALRASVQEYMQYDTQLDDTLRNNWAVLGSLLAPALEAIIRLFGIAVAYVRAFIKALTGVDLVAKANAKSMKAVGESAKKTLGNLAKFDELNTVDFPDASGGGGSDIPPLTTPEIDTSSLDRFVALIKKGDWYGLGMELGKKFNEGLRTINFDEIIAKARQWATNLADLLNGLTDGIDWALLGEKIAGGLNTVLTFANTFFDTYNFDNLGMSLAEGMNSMVNNVDFEGIGQFLTNGIASFIDGAFYFVRDFDFKKFGDGIAKGVNGAVNNIDFGAFGATLAGAFTGILDTIGSAFKNVDWGTIGQEISNFVYNILEQLRTWIQDTDWYQVGQDLYDALVSFLSNVDWSGIVSTLFELLGSAVGALGSLVAGLCKDIVNSIGEYLTSFVDEDASWAENGKNIILGILGGIVDAIANIGQWIYDNIFEPFIDGFKEAFQIHSPSKVMEEQGGFILSGLLNGLKGIGEKVKKVFQEAKDAIAGKISETVDTIKTKLSWQNLSDAFNTLKNNIGNKFVEIKNGIGTTMGTASSTIKDKMSEAWSGIKSTFSGVGAWFERNVANPIKNAFNTAWGGIKSILNIMIGGINLVIRGLNKLSFKVPDWVPEFGGKKWGFNIPEIPKLATGTNRIEAEGLYHLHKNEAVVPEKYNPAVNDNVYSKSNQEVVSEIRSLRGAIESLGITNVVNVGNKTLYKETINYAKQQNSIYGESVVTI